MKAPRPTKARQYLSLTATGLCTGGLCLKLGVMQAKILFCLFRAGLSARRQVASRGFVFKYKSDQSSFGVCEFVCVCVLCVSTQQAQC